MAGALERADLLYFSGITLAILARGARQRLLSLLAERRRQGALIAFDPNYRPALWPDVAAAQAAFTAAFRIADVALPTFEDEARLFGDASPDATAARIGALGTPEIVVKDGPQPCLVALSGQSERVPAIRPDKVVDTTGAGDSFGAAYVCARQMGLSPKEAARLGHAVAAQVIGVRGALAPIDREGAFRAVENGRGA